MKGDDTLTKLKYVYDKYNITFPVVRKLYLIIDNLFEIYDKTDFK